MWTESSVSAESCSEIFFRDELLHDRLSFFAGSLMFEEKLLDRIHALREEGYTFLLVEHDMDVIMNNCERIIVMHQGQVLADGTSEDIQNNEQVIKAYLGEDI